MRVVIQRVNEASVTVDEKVVSSIGKGVLVLLGIEHDDSNEDADWLVNKLAALRIFPDEQGVNNLSLLDVGGDAIVVSQFTLHASTKKGKRPSYIRAARPEQATPLYEYFVRKLQLQTGKPIGTGIFGAMMQVSLVNDGPVTILIDSKNKE